MRTFMKHKIKTQLAACALAGAAFSGSALGAIVCASPNLPLPQNLDGFYINLVTGATGTSGSLTPGWDFNPYASNGATLLSFNASSTAPAAGYVSSGGVITPLSAGTQIDASSTYLAGLQTSAAAMGAYRAGVASGSYLGFRLGESGNTYYGWLNFTTTGPNGFPATLLNYCYENTGAAIAAGDTGAPSGSADFGFSVSSLAFGNVEIGSTSASQTVTLRNYGDAPGQIASFNIAAPFSITGGTCGASPELDEDEECTVQVVFSPTVAGAASGNLDFTESAPLVITSTRGTITTVALSGNGTEPPAGTPQFSFSTNTLNFGSVNVGSSSPPQSVTLGNYGDAMGTITSLDTGDPAYAITGGTCGSTPFALDPTETCTIAVTFTPSAAGSVEGSLTFGTGVPFPEIGGQMPNGNITAVELNGNGVEGGPGPGPGGTEPVVANVPVNSPWALAALLGLFGLIAGAMLRRR